LLKLGFVEKFGGSCRLKVTFCLAVRLYPEQSGTLLRPKFYFPIEKLPLSYRETPTFLPKNSHFSFEM